MSKQEKKSLKRELESGKKPILYDFLYHDFKRIASFLSQFDDFGHLQQVTKQDNYKTGSVSTKTGTVKASVPGVIEGSLNKTRSPSEEEQDNLEKRYDPLWINALNFLTHLENIQILHNDINKARIGQFIKIRGELEIIDFNFVKNCFASSDLVNFIQGSNNNFSNRTERRSKRKHENDEFKFMQSIMSIVPYSLQGIINLMDTSKVWFTLDPVFMGSQVSDISLKYGSKLDGKWSIVGIMDVALVNHEKSTNNDSIDSDGNQTETLWSSISSCLSVIREIIGRPLNTPSITPLLIYREITE